MAKIKYDVSSAPASGGATPKPGTYKCKIVEAVDRSDQGKTDIQVVLEIKEGKFKGSRIWTYVSYSEAAAWKMRQFVEALNLKTKGILDTDRLVGKEVGVVVTNETWEGEPRARANRFIKATSVESDAPEPDDIDEDEDEEDEDEEDTDDEDEDEEDDEEDEDDDEEEDLEALSLKELIALAKERRLATTAAQRKSKAALIELLSDGDEDEDEDDEEDVDDEEENEEPEPPKAKRGRAAKKPEPEPEEDEDEDEDEEASEEDYSTWDLDELKEECESRGLSTKGSKTSLAKRLEKDDSENNPF